jgi:putative Holliday junction resolvase
MTRILALDIGDRRIGVALSDSGGILASPFAIIERKAEEDDVQTILDIVSRQGAGEVVIGLPRSMNGTLGEQAKKVMAFVDRLRERTDVSVKLRDERLSTVSAKRLMQASGSRKKGRKVRDDAAAAAIILQGYLDEPREQNNFT